MELIMNWTDRYLQMHLKLLEEAFNLIESYTKIDFEEITETGDVVGDFRMESDANHFGMNLSYGAYSQGVSHGPAGGNIFFNGTIDKDNDGICDYNEADKLGKNSFILLLFYTKLSIHWVKTSWNLF